MKIALRIMAAGIGNRFGTGIKQLEPIDASEHIISSSLRRNILGYPMPHSVR